MAKTRKKKQQHREQKRLHGEMGTLHRVTVDNEPDDKPAKIYNIGVSAFGELRPRQPQSLRSAILSAVIFSAQHLGHFDEKMIKKVIAGKITTLYIDVSSLVDEIDRFVQSYHPTPPEPRTTPADNAKATMANARSEWVPAIPEPLYGAKKQCSCGRKFWRSRNYEAHYALEHIVLGELPL